MRLFTGVVPTASALEHLRNALSSVYDERLRWVDDDALHVTLAFYGEVDDNRVGDLIDRLHRTGQRHPHMNLRVAGAGRFGDAVLWVGLRGETERLRPLAASAAAAGRRVGAAHDESRTFRPHITVARSRGEDVRPYVKALSEYEGPPWQASEMLLIRSRLGAGAGRRSVYENVATIPLGSPE